MAHIAAHACLAQPACSRQSNHPTSFSITPSHQRQGVARTGIVTKAIEENVKRSVSPTFDVDKPVKAGDIARLEQDFINAMQSFYYEGRCNMSEVDFLTLQEELLWSGSQVAILSDTEKMYLDGCWAKQEGAPIMSDAEFVEICKELQKQGSVIVAPRKKANDFSVTVGVMLAALAGLGIYAGVYGTSLKGQVSSDDLKLPPVTDSATDKPEPTLAERLNFLRKRDETAALQKALAETQARLGDAEKRVETMQSRLEAGREQIDKLEGAIATLSKEKSELEGTQKEQDAYLVTLNDQLANLETQAERQRLILMSLTGPNGRMAEMRAKIDAADAEVARLRNQEAELKAQQMEELSRLQAEKDELKAKSLEEIARMRLEKEELAARVEKETARYLTEKEELEAQQERVKAQAASRELSLLSERDAIKATAEKQAKLLEIIAAPDGKITALKSEVTRAESAASKLREELAELQKSLEDEYASYAKSNEKISDLESKVQAATKESEQKAQQKAAVINEINAKVAQKQSQKAALEANLKAEADAQKAAAAKLEAAVQAEAALKAEAAKAEAEEKAAAAEAAKAEAARAALQAEAAAKAKNAEELAKATEAAAPAPGSEDEPAEAPKPFRKVYGKYSRV